MNIDTTITIDTLLNTGLALLGWLYIMSRTWRWLGSILLKQWKKRRKQELRQKRRKRCPGMGKSTWHTPLRSRQPAFRLRHRARSDHVQ